MKTQQTNKPVIIVKTLNTLTVFKMKGAQPLTFIMIGNDQIKKYGLAIALDLYIERNENSGYWFNWTNAQNIRKAMGL